jgi:hypothetical protein
MTGPACFTALARDLLRNSDVVTKNVDPAMLAAQQDGENYENDRTTG